MFGLGSLLLLASAALPSGHVASGSPDIVLAMKAFEQICWRHVGDDVALEKAVGSTSLPFSRDDSNSTAYSSVWTVSGAKVIFSKGSQFPVPLCTLYLRTSVAFDDGGVESSFKSLLGLDDKFIDKKLNKGGKAWRIPMSNNRTFLVGVGRPTSSDEGNVGFTVQIFKTSSLTRTQH